LATLASQVVKRSGVGPTYAACTGGGDRFTPSATTILHVKNGSGGALTVTVPATKVPAPDMVITNNVVSVPASGERMMGPFPPDIFQATDGSGLADITYSGVTSLTIAAVQVSQP
jgi:hypothetical protein